MSILRRVIPIALICGASITPAAEPRVFNEFEMKAAFLFNFAKFVEWPGEKGAQGTPIVLAILGPNPFGVHLTNLVKGRRINGREIQVRQLDSLDSARGAHVLFVTKGARKTAEEVSAALGGAGVLTVGEPTAFSEVGGIITFHLEADRLSFEIDMGEAERAGLSISAQLQKLASAVRRR